MKTAGREGRKARKAICFTFHAYVRTSRQRLRHPLTSRFYQGALLTLLLLPSLAIRTFWHGTAGRLHHLQVPREREVRGGRRRAAGDGLRLRRRRGRGPVRVQGLAQLLHSFWLVVDRREGNGFFFWRGRIELFFPLHFDFLFLLETPWSVSRSVHS